MSASAPPTTTASTGITEDEAALYDRQLRLWGVEAQNRMRNANVLLAGSFKGIAAEVAKNRVQVSAPRLQLLNPRVQLTTHTDPSLLYSESFLAPFDLVVLTDVDAPTLSKVNALTRKLGKKLFAASSTGIHGWVFADLLEHEFIVDKEKTLSPGETITVPTKLTHSYVPFEEALRHDFAAKGQPKLRAKTKGKREVLWGVLAPIAAEDLKKAAQEVLPSMGVDAGALSDEVIFRLAPLLALEFPPSCAVLGGICGQDVLNAVGGKEEPVRNLMIELPARGRKKTMYAQKPVRPRVAPPLALGWFSLFRSLLSSLALWVSVRMPVRTVFTDSEDPLASPPPRSAQQSAAAPASTPPSRPSPLANSTPGTGTGTGSGQKRQQRDQGNGQVQDNGAGSASKKPRLVSFTESDEEDGAGHSAHSTPVVAKAVNGRPLVLANGGTAGRQRKVLSVEEKRRLRDEARRLESGRKELPVWEEIPQFLMRSSVPCAAPRIVCTQPRRVAATSLASRVSSEVGCPLGGLVGYTVRFDDRSTLKTRLKYATDGALLAEMLGDRDLDAYDVVVLDEAHERSLRTDMLMGFLKEIQTRRKEKVRSWREGKGAGKGKGKEDDGEEDKKLDEREPTELKIVVMSATIDAKRFSDFFNSAPVLFIRGRQHKVTIKYTNEPQEDYLDAALKTVFQIHLSHPPGAVLVFLPGQDEIESLQASIKQYLPDLQDSFPGKGSVRHALFASLSPPSRSQFPAFLAPLTPRPTHQARAFAPAPPNMRKIILATNVAETSVTLPGVKYVVDCGLAKEKRYHAGTGIDSLITESISQSSAKQRAGRAGRESDGYCFRLYTETDFLTMPQRTEPEIQRVSLTFALLHLLAAGQENVFEFEYMDRPDKDSIMFALLTLHGLSALDARGRITPLGLRMAQLPLDPVYARVLLASFAEGCPREAIDLVALLGSKDQLLAVSSANRDAAAEARQKFVHRSGDHLTLLNVLRAFEELPKEKDERKVWCRDNFVSLKAMMQVLDARKQLRERVERLDVGDWEVSAGEEAEPVLNALVGGLFANTALRMEDGSYRHTIVAIHPSSTMHNRKAPAILYDELVLTTKTYARGVSSIDPRSIRTKAPTIFSSTTKTAAQE
ncbi:SPOSA6832_04364 [Sporobolomyces salmonicolor]|uniref:RNA helicase n=1 Tax=Sporidiobolus salmonicolor TaxID=5005 RepID=A0A0D6ERS1_SPOSA|nr:SPOSA6832_04364 [Sporobolomyces salmonicolor]